MRQVLPSAQRPSGGGTSFPAPVGGWNARDPIANMPATDAIFLDNFFPRTSDVALRPGSILHATLPADTIPASPHDVRSLMSYQASDGTAKLFAGCEGGVYDVTAGGTVTTPASAATGTAWEFVNISTAGGSFLWTCNGVDDARYFNGTAWTVLNGASSPALTGITSSDITNVNSFKARLYLCKKNSLSFYYLSVNSVAGAASEFPLGAVFTKGGYLMATGTWTLDGGNGPEDYFVAVSSEGEVAIYAGTDPSNAATWGLQGVYYIGVPLSRRCLVKLGGDLGVLTVRGLYPLSKALQSATVDQRSALSDKISKAWVDYTSIAGDHFGWQPILYPEATLLLVNVPVVSQQAEGNVYSYQFVMNTQTKAWCRFTGMPSEVWGVHDGKLFFALHNKVFQAWIGQSDVSTGAIDARAKQAFFYPSGRGRSSQITLLRPIITASSGDIKVQLSLDTDYDDSLTAFTSITYAQGIAIWDQSRWDQAYWTSSATIAKWKSVNHRPGRAVAVRLRFLGKGVNMSWNATDMILKSAVLSL